MRVLITDGGERAALAAARALVAAGHEVHVTAPGRLALAAASRGVRPVVLRSDALDDAPGYAAAIGALARQRDIHAILPVTDPSVEALLEHRAALPPSAALPLPGLETYRAASDKVRMLDHARAAGLTVPESLVLVSPADAVTLPGPGFFPAVLKPHRSVVATRNGARTKLGVGFADDREQCARLLAALPEGAYPVLLQRRVHGPGEGMFLLRWDDRYVAEFAHRRLREKPPAGGVSVYRESIAAPPLLAASARRLLDALDWRGVAMVECKRDREAGRHVFMEINGRLWGSLQLAIDAGVDFPGLLLACARGAAPPPVTRYRVGVRSRWLWGDVDHLYLRLARSERALHLDGDTPSRLGALRDFLAFHPGRDREEIWRWRDPAPFIVETLRRLGAG